MYCSLCVDYNTFNLRTIGYRHDDRLGSSQPLPPQPQATPRRRRHILQELSDVSPSPRSKPCSVRGVRPPKPYLRSRSERSFCPSHKRQVMEPPQSIWEDLELSPKIRDACAVARKNGYDYIWIDSCCIDKAPSFPKPSTPCTSGMVSRGCATRILLTSSRG